jgi:hypothetical protein
VASAHLAAFEHVSAAAQACERLGGLTSGRWRAAARQLSELEDDLERAFSGAADTLTSRADELGVPEDALWTVGDAAGTLDLLRETALGEVEEGTRPARVLESTALFGASFVEDPELPDRGTTLLFGWAQPLAPATWPWQANWIAGDTPEETNGDAAEALADALDLYEVGEMEGDAPLVAELAAELDCSAADARGALRDAALALTRASLIAGDTDEGDADDDDNDGTSANGAP